jgi:C-terminal processing protease CtpA/Prc
VPGDLLLAVDGRTIAETGFEGAVQRIRGAEGTTVVLRVRRADGRESDVVATRTPVRPP